MTKKIVASVILGAALSAYAPQARAFWYGTPGFSLRDGRSQVQAVYDTGTRSITPSNGGPDIDMDSHRFYVQYGRGFGNGLDLFGRLMPQTGDLSFENSNYSPSIWGLGGGVHWAPAQAGPVHWGVQANLDYNNGKDQGTKTTITEVALDGGGSYRPSNNVDVYGGLSFMDSNIKLSNGFGDAKFELSDHFGLFGGVGFYPTPNVTLGFELHLISETIFGFSGAYRFGGGASASSAPRSARPRSHRRR